MPDQTGTPASAKLWVNGWFECRQAETLASAIDQCPGVKPLLMRLGEHQ